MANRKYENYILTELKLPSDVEARQPVYNQRATRILWLEDEIVEGASSVILSWYWKATGEKESTPSHVHDFDEIIGFIGGDPQHPGKLYGEVEMWMDDEKYLLDKSCLIYIPKGLRHCPIKILRADRPFLFVAFSGTTKYIKEKIQAASK